MALYSQLHSALYCYRHKCFYGKYTTHKIHTEITSRTGVPCFPRLYNWWCNFPLFHGCLGKQSVCLHTKNEIYLVASRYEQFFTHLQHSFLKYCFSHLKVKFMSSCCYVISHIGYEMVDSQWGAECQVCYNIIISYPISVSGMIVLLKTALKYIKLN